MKSGIKKSRRTTSSSKSVGSAPYTDEVYDLRGLNVSDPDQITQDGESPNTLNTRMYATLDGQKRVAIRTRKGSRRLSTPIGETLNVQNVAANSGDATFTNSSWIAEPFTPSSTGALTKFELEIRKTSTASGGHVIVEIFSDNAGVPGTLLCQGAILSANITTSYQYLPAYFMDAPTLISGTQYWHRVRVQDGGAATYGISKTAAAGGYSTVTPGALYTALGYTWHYKSYLSTAGTIKGFFRRYPSTNANRTLFAMDTGLYSVTDAGVPTLLGSTISSIAKAVRFDQVNDTTYLVDGNNPAQQWDGTTLSNVSGVPGNPTHVIVHQNRLMFVPADDPTRVNFSDLFNFVSYPIVNFFYVPSPKSPDKISGWIEFQDNLVIFTRETKHTVAGADIGSFTRREAIGTKGAVTQEAICADRNYIYFMADDKQIYRFNGVEDELLSEKIQPLLSGITDTSKVRMHLYRNQLRVYYPSGANTQSSDMVLLELSNKENNKSLQWFHDTGRAVTGSLEWTQTNNELIEFSSKVGAIYLGETDESDMGKAINFLYWTKYKMYQSGSSKDRIKRFRPYVRPSDASYVMQVGKDIDFANKPVYVPYTVNPGGAQWGSFNWGDGTIWGNNTQFVDDKVAMSGRGKFTQFRFECALVESPVQLYGYIALVKSGRVR